MTLANEILTVLSSEMSAGRPWLSTIELRSLLQAKSPGISLSDLAPTIRKLAQKGILEVKALYNDDLDRGFIARMTVQGRNKWIYGHSLTGP